MDTNDLIDAWGQFCFEHIYLPLVVSFIVAVIARWEHEKEHHKNED